MTNSIDKKLMYAFNEVLAIAEHIRCDGLHHNKNQYHEIGELCKAEAHVKKQANIIRAYIDKANSEQEQ